MRNFSLPEDLDPDTAYAVITLLDQIHSLLRDLYGERIAEHHRLLESQNKRPSDLFDDDELPF